MTQTELHVIFVLGILALVQLGTRSEILNVHYEWR